MIFSRALTLAALPLLAVATHGLRKARTTSSPCSTGSLLCCSSVEQVRSARHRPCASPSAQHETDIPTCSPLAPPGSRLQRPRYSGCSR